MCKSEEEDNYHFIVSCKAMRPEFHLFSQNYSHLLKLNHQLKQMCVRDLLLIVPSLPIAPLSRFMQLHAGQ